MELRSSKGQQRKCSSKNDMATQTSVYIWEVPEGQSLGLRSGSLDGEKRTQSLFTVQTIFCIYSVQGLLRQWDKWVRPQWPVAPMHVLTYTRAQGSLVFSSYLAMVSQAQLSGPLLRIQIFSSDSYVVKEGAAISITSLGHALSSSTTLGAQLPWFWLLHLSSMTFLLLPFLFIYLYPEFAHNQSTLWLLLMVNLLSLQMSILRCWGEKIFLQITKRVKTQCAQLLVLWILYLNRLDNY